jgi:hypothetical protein
MTSKLLAGVGLAAVLVIVVVLMVTLAAIGGLVWFFIDDDPLLHYDARPATVDDGTLKATGYERVNATDFEMEFTPIPRGKGIAVRTWATLYVKLPPGVENDGGTAHGSSPDSFDPSTVSMAALFSTSALKVGPVAFNPLVYAAHPGLLDASGELIDRFETWLPKEVTEVTGVDVESSRQVSMLDTDSELSTFTGELVMRNESTGEAEAVEVRMYLARAVVDGELVIALGVGAPDNETAEEFATLVEGVEMAAWGAEPESDRVALSTGGVGSGDRSAIPQ